MLIFPAIDLLNGRCVRLTQGDYSKVKTYHSDPLEVAKEIASLGSAFVHIVDLDGAKSKKPVNTKSILEITKKTQLTVQVGGGIRTREAAEELFQNGVARIILGTSAYNNKSFLSDLLERYGSQKIIVSTDIKDDKIALDGWTGTGNNTVDDFLSELKSLGVEKIIVTDIERDGMMGGVNVSKLQKLMNTGFDVIVAGGVSSLLDLDRLQKMNSHGAIIGKAFYEKKLDLKEVCELYPQSNLTKRIIPCLDVKDKKVVKGTHFVNLRDAGDAVELGELYSKSGADELVFLDITATTEKRKILVELAEKVASVINIPFTIGGGIKTLEDIQLLLSKGADKVSIGSEAFLNPHLIYEAASKFGSQAIVISIDARRNKEKSIWEAYIKGGHENTFVNAVTFAKQMVSQGAGELLVNSLDKDGVKDGFDIQLMKIISNDVSVPVIASSGAGTMEHFDDVLNQTKVTAVLAASVFHYGEISIIDLKKYLKKRGHLVRL